MHFPTSQCYEWLSLWILKHRKCILTLTRCVAVNNNSPGWNTCALRWWLPLLSGDRFVVYTLDVLRHQFNFIINNVLKISGNLAYCVESVTWLLFDGRMFYLKFMYRHNSPVTKDIVSNCHIIRIVQICWVTLQVVHESRMFLE